MEEGKYTLKALIRSVGCNDQLLATSGLNLLWVAYLTKNFLLFSTLLQTTVKKKVEKEEEEKE